MFVAPFIVNGEYKGQRLVTKAELKVRQQGSETYLSYIMQSCLFSRTPTTFAGCWRRCYAGLEACEAHHQNTAVSRQGAQHVLLP
jgi:hypothetical protein